jgi:hypothetical protein
VLLMGDIRDLSDTEPMTPGQIRKAIERIELIRQFEPDRIKQTVRQWVTVRARDEKYVAAARTRLIEAGIAEERIALFPAPQIILLDEKREFETRRDEATKYMKLATWEFEKYASKEVKPTTPALLDLYLPSYWKVRRAQGRLEQRISLLRHVEAIRMYAANHDGRLPESLDAIDLPLPVDPFTGKPFRYAKDGNTAHLRGNPPRGDQKNPGYNLHYEITIRK